MAGQNVIKFGVFPLEHMAARAHEYVGLTEMMPPATLHGAGVITKLYFIIFWHLKNQLP